VHASAIKLFILIKKYLLGLNNVMASFDINIPPETNAGSQYFNINQCRSFKITLATNKAMTRFTSTGQVADATAVAGFPCGEVIVVNKSGKTIEVYDNNHTTDTVDCIFMDDNDTFTFRGLTNTGDISAKNVADNAAATIYVRAQFFSDNPAR
jgi:hypothetical protein